MQRFLPEHRVLFPLPPALRLLPALPLQAGSPTWCPFIANAAGAWPAASAASAPAVQWSSPVASPASRFWKSSHAFPRSCSSPASSACSAMPYGLAQSCLLRQLLASGDLGVVPISPARSRSAHSTPPCRPHRAPGPSSPPALDFRSPVFAALPSYPAALRQFRYTRAISPSTSCPPPALPARIQPPPFPAPRLCRAPEVPRLSKPPLL